MRAGGGKQGEQLISLLCRQFEDFTDTPHAAATTNKF